MSKELITKLVESLQKQKRFYEEDGALWSMGVTYGIDNAINAIITYESMNEKEIH